MKRIVVVIHLISAYYSFSQPAEYFHLSQPDRKISKSLYGEAGFIDSRSDTNTLGRIYSDRFKRKLPVLPKIDFYTQFNWLLHQATDSTKGNKELFIQLRKLEFVEPAGEAPRFGYCPVRVDLYLHKSNSYYPLGRLDTIVFVDTDALDLTKVLFEKGSNVVSEFIFKYLILPCANEKSFSYSDIKKIDSLEKSTISLYCTEKYTEGAYLSFDAFKSQVPDFKLIEVNYQFGEIHALVLQDKWGRKIRRKSNQVYATVYQGVPYVSGEMGCYPIEKKEGNFYFKAKGKVLPGDESLALAQAFGGYLGRQIAYNSAIGTFEVKLDHIDGSFIWLKKIK